MGDVLGEAQQAVQERAASYGHPADNFARIGRLWNGYLFERLGSPLTVADVAVLCALIKVGRMLEPDGFDVFDNWVDLAGYADAGWTAHLGSKSPL